MPSLRYRISIQSTPENVFAVITDFNKYGQWNPWIKMIEGTAAEGEQVFIKLKLTTVRAALAYTIIRLRSPDIFSWRESGMFKFLVYSERERCIFPRADGAAIYSTRLQFYGPLASIVAWFYGKAVYRGLRDEAHALKSYCEKNFPVRKTELAVRRQPQASVNKDINNNPVGTMFIH